MKTRLSCYKKNGGKQRLEDYFTSIEAFELGFFALVERSQDINIHEGLQGCIIMHT